MRIGHDQSQRQRLQEPLPIAVLNTSDMEQERSSTSIDGTFLHTKLFIDTLLSDSAPVRPTDKNELIELCRQYYAKNNSELAIINEFERTYTNERALWWYTRQSFLYQVLNRAMRVDNVDIIFLFRFFIRDIHQRLLKIQRQQLKTTPTCLYRAQLMSELELGTLLSSVGQLISMNTFLSTSLDRDYVLFILGDSDQNSGVRRVLIEIDINPRIQNRTLFADITKESYFPAESEVLFMLGSIFRLTEMSEENGLWTIRMTLCGDDDHDLKNLQEYMRNHHDLHGFLSIGDVLWKAGKFEQAERYNRRLLCTDDLITILMRLYNEAVTSYEKGHYETCLKWLDKLLEYSRPRLGTDVRPYARVFNFMGVVYDECGQPEKALKSYRIAQVALTALYGERSEPLALVLNNIGVIYIQQMKYTLAMDYLTKSLTIRTEILPFNSSPRAQSYFNIGVLYLNLEEPDSALQYFNKALIIYNRSLPSDHPDIASTHQRIGAVYYYKQDYSQALSHLQKASKIFHKKRSATHPEVLNTDGLLALVQSNLT